MTRNTHPKRPVSAKLMLGAGTAALMLFGMIASSGVAQADHYDHRGWGHHRHYDRGYDQGYEGGYYGDDYPPPVVYGSPYEYPPPVVYGPRIGVYLPGVSIGIH